MRRQTWQTQLFPPAPTTSPYIASSALRQGPHLPHLVQDLFQPLGDDGSGHPGQAQIPSHCAGIDVALIDGGAHVPDHPVHEHFAAQGHRELREGIVQGGNPVQESCMTGFRSVGGQARPLQEARCMECTAEPLPPPRTEISRYLGTSGGRPQGAAPGDVGEDGCV